MRLLQPDSSIKYLLYCFFLFKFAKYFLLVCFRVLQKKIKLKNYFKRDLSLSQMKIKVIIIIEQEICVKQLKLSFNILDLAKLCSQQKILVFCLKLKKKPNKVPLFLSIQLERSTFCKCIHTIAMIYCIYSFLFLPNNSNYPCIIIISIQFSSHKQII